MKHIPSLSRILVMFAFSLAQFAACTNIIECATITDLLNHAQRYNPATTLIIFDVDNTIATPYHEFGTDQWFSKLHAHHMHRGASSHNALGHVLPFYLALQHVIALHPVELYTPITIKTLQAAGFATIALTMRSSPIAQRTVEQLRAMHIDFAHTQVHQQPIVLATPNNAEYRDGIIFCNGDAKEDALEAFCIATNARPEAIIFIDDKEHYLRAVAQFAHRQNIDYLGLRYSYCDRRVNNFNHAHAHEQLCHYLHCHAIVAQHAAVHTVS